MPFIDLKGDRFHYMSDGSESSPALILSNSLGCSVAMWEPQLAELSKHFRVVRYDQRGHGQSAVTPGPYSFKVLAEDVIKLMDALKIQKAHFLGLSMGGGTGQWLGVHHAARFNKLILSNTAAKFGTPDVWNTRIETVRKGGMAAVVDATIERWFTAGFRAQKPPGVDAIRKVFLATNPAGFIACSEGIRDADLQEIIRGIKLPTMVIAGAHDAGTPPAANKLIAERIAGAKYVELNAAHISNIEQAAEYNKTVLGFLTAK